MRSGARLSFLRVNITGIETRGVGGAINGEQPTLGCRLHQPVAIVHRPTGSFYRVLRYLHGAESRQCGKVFLHCCLVDGPKPTSRIHSTNNGCAVACPKLTGSDHAVHRIDTVCAPPPLQFSELFCKEAPLRVAKSDGSTCLFYLIVPAVGVEASLHNVGF